LKGAVLATGALDVLEIRVVDRLLDGYLSNLSDAQSTIVKLYSHVGRIGVGEAR
jgi:hypothetical protein